MNNRCLCNYFAKISLSAILLASLFVQAKADTLYGPLRSGETLSSIVNQNYLTSPYDDSVIMRQVLRMNPQAFILNNMSRMRQGAMLTLPSDATVRRSQQGNSTTRVIQSVPRANSASTLALEATLSQVRGERDQANLRIRRIRSESSAKLETLTSQVKQLEADKQTVNNQLKTTSAELAEQKQSIESLKQVNSQLVAGATQAAVVDAADDQTLKKLEESDSVIAEKQQQINDLESSFSTINKETESLKSSHQIAINELQSSNIELEEKLKLVNQDATAEELKKQHELDITIIKTQHQQAVEDLEAGSQSKELQITKLSSENKTLSEALSVAKISSATSAENALTKEQVTTDLGKVDSIQTVDSDPLISGPLTQKLFVQELQKPVAFPLWGLLFGAFALGFTSLMLLFTRSRKQLIPAVSASSITAHQVVSQQSAAAEDYKKEKLVFHAGDPSAQDPDVETLRVPPRRDTSRVAIMDPTMSAVGLAATATTAAVAVTIQLDSNDVKISAPTNFVTDQAVSESQQFDSKLKLLIAETYQELGEPSAENELLLEVMEEGSQEQIAEALTRITPVNH